MNPNQTLVPHIRGTSTQKACKKHTYWSLEIANATLEIIRNRVQAFKKKKPIRAYKCPRCGKFHLTSMSLKEYRNKFKKHLKTNTKMENTTVHPNVSILGDASTGKPMFFKKCDAVQSTEKGITVCQGCHQSQNELTYFVINNLSGKPMASFRDAQKRDEYHAKMKPSDQERFRPDTVTIKFLD